VQHGPAWFSAALFVLAALFYLFGG
jgi:hypothetical protein